MAVPFEVVSQHRCFGGVVGFYRHESATTACPMRFSVFTPPQAQSGRVPLLYYLAGLTCTEETFMIKAGAQRVAAELGIMLVAPDTSPRGVKLPGDSDSWDFGVAAGFYVDATVEPWSRHYRMYTYVTQELRTLIESHFPADPARTGIFGHSMGGHGALTLALRNPERYRNCDRNLFRERRHIKLHFKVARLASIRRDRNAIGASSPRQQCLVWRGPKRAWTKRVGEPSK